MALTPNDAIVLAKAMNHKVPVDSVQAYVCDQVNSIIWTAYPWIWTQSTLTAINCVDGIQDYAHTQTDWYRFVSIRLVQTNLTPIEHRELDQKNHLGVEVTQKGGIASVRVFSWEPSISKIRLDRAIQMTGTTTLQIQGEYQRTPIAITQATLGTALVQPDHYFNTFLAGVRWMFYDLADDPRAGTATEVTIGRKQYSGQLGVFMSFIDAMKQAEDFGNGEDLNFPSDPLGPTSNAGFPGIYP